MSLSLGELTGALGEIPERQRRALLLREFQGMSYEEIAGELGVSVAAVETLLFRARRSLADQLEQTGMPRHRGAVASVVAVFRWFFDGSAVPLKLAAVTAAVGTTATLALVPTLGSKPAEPVQTIPSLVTPAAHTAGAVQARTVSRVKRGVRGRAAQTVRVISPTSVGHTAPEPASSARSGSGVHAVQTQQRATPSSLTGGTSPPTLAPPTDLQDVTDSVPITVPDVSPPSVELPPVGSVDAPQLPELPKLP